MAKILFLAIAVAVAWWLLRGRLRASADRDRQPGGTAPAEHMVRCAHCGVHLPRGESIASGERFFCSSQHERDFSGQG